MYTGNQRILLKEGISACSFFKILKTKFFLLSTLSTCFYIITKNPVIDILFNKYWLRDIYFKNSVCINLGFPGGSVVKNPPAVQEI